MTYRGFISNQKFFIYFFRFHFFHFFLQYIASQKSTYSFAFFLLSFPIHFVNIFVPSHNLLKMTLDTKSLIKALWILKNSNNFIEAFESVPFSSLVYPIIVFEKVRSKFNNLVMFCWNVTFKSKFKFIQKEKKRIYYSLSFISIRVSLSSLVVEYLIVAQVTLDRFQAQAIFSPFFIQTFDTFDTFDTFHVLCSSLPFLFSHLPQTKNRTYHMREDEDNNRTRQERVRLDQ